jgi:DNA polymerase-1
VTTVLLDADTGLYASAAGAEKALEFEEGHFTLVADLDDAKGAYDEWVSGICKKIGKVKKVIHCLSDSGNYFRSDHWPAYKDGRGKKPLIHAQLRSWLIGSDGHETMLRPRLEADDILGILATHKALVKGPKIVVSIDKDLLQIPGKHYNPAKDEFREVDEESGEYLFFTQTLTGDATDNYPGCPGIGPKRAPAIIGDLDGAWERIVAAYEKAGLSEADALAQARTARILRASDYDFKKKEPILWTPSAS